MNLRVAHILTVLLTGVWIGGACHGQDTSTVPAGYEWSQLKGNSGFTGLSPDDSLKPPLKLVWSFRLDGDAGGDAGAGLIVAGGKVFVPVANSQSIVALDAESGRFCWEYRDPSIGWNGYLGHTSVPSYDNSRVILWQRRNSSGVLALDAETGEVAWAQSLSPEGKDVNRGGLPVADGMVYCSEGGPEPAVVAFDTASGERVWRTKLGKDVGEYAIGPTVAGGRVFVSTRANTRRGPKPDNFRGATNKYFPTLLTGIVFLSAASHFTPPAHAAEKPNILFIFADDWGWGDLSCHGHPYVKTPNIDRLAREGTDFHRFTVASGVCSPSRTAVMTGHFPARYNIDGHFAWVPNNANRNMPDWLSPKAPLLPRFLQQAGYATAHFGKWHLSNNMISDSPLPSEYGYDEYGAFNCAGEQMPYYDDARNAVAFIERSHRQKKPFFINLWIHEPHTPFHTVPKYRWRFRDLEERDNIYASVLSHADDRIGDVLDALDRLKLTADTLVIFSSDNGPARAARPTELTLMHDTATGAGYGIGAARGITGGRKGYKGALFEGGIGVPFIARWPGKIAAGKVDKSSLLSAVDLLPTFCELAGVQLPKTYSPDGISQVDTLLGKASATRTKPLFWKMRSSWPIQNARPYHWVSYAVVLETWKLLANRDSTYVELYDLAGDPYEKIDLKEDRPEVVQRLLQDLDRWKATIPAKPSGDVFSDERTDKSPK